MPKGITNATALLWEGAPLAEAASGRPLLTPDIFPFTTVAQKVL